MIKKIVSIYKVPLLISLTLSIVMLALTVTRDPINIIQILLGCFVGTFFLDLEYLLFAYVFEPRDTFSVNLTHFVKDKDFSGAFIFIHSHKKDLKDLSLNSAIFQVVLAGLSIFVAYANISFFVKAFVFSIFVSSIYKLMENYYDNTLNDWFWAFKERPTQQNVLPYIVGTIAVLMFCLIVL